jgi:hypothetical protein
MATQAQATKYYNTMTEEEQAAVDASGGPSVAWLQAAIDAGVPKAVRIGGAQAGSDDPYEEAGPTDALGNPNAGYDAEEGGTIAPYGSAADSADWMGKRKPTVGELRKWARAQHSGYLGGDRNSQDEDYERYNDQILSAWIKESWDVQGGSFRNSAGDLVAKPPDTAGGQGGPGGQGGGGGRGGWGPPPPPTTFGNQLGMTGNTMQDMLITQFNTGQDSTYAQGNNLFGLGEDRAVGGEDANADDQSQNEAQTLAGGGLWWGQDDFNQGFDATKVTPDAAPQQGRGRGRNRQQQQGQPQEAVQEGSEAAVAPAEQGPQEPNNYSPGMANMMNNQNWKRGNNRRNDMSDMMFDSYGGGGNF